MDTFKLPRERIDEAYDSISDELIESLELAAQRVKEFHESVLPQDWMDQKQGLGQLIRPIERVGVYVPGGKASYPLSVTPKISAATNTPGLILPALSGGEQIIISFTPATLAGITFINTDEG